MFLHGGISYMSSSFSDHIAEALAMRKALSWLKEYRFSNVLVEIDALALIQVIPSVVDLTRNGDQFLKLNSGMQ